MNYDPCQFIRLETGNKMPMYFKRERELPVQLASQFQILKLTDVNISN